MNNSVNYEKRRYRDKTREILTLFIFTIGAGITSLVVMDLIILPLALFAIHKKEMFNYFIKDLMVVFIIIGALLLFARKIYGLVRDGYSIRETAKYLLSRPLGFLGSFLVIILLTALMILFLYLLLSFNNYQIYRFTNS